MQLCRWFPDAHDCIFDQQEHGVGKQFGQLFVGSLALISDSTLELMKPFHHVLQQFRLQFDTGSQHHALIDLTKAGSR